MPAALDLTNQRQHPDSKLIPLRKVRLKQGWCWICLCEECGEETKPIYQGRLRPSKTTGKFQISCRKCASKRENASRRTDHTGETYGRLRVLKYIGNPRGHWLFHCAPDLGGCGKKKPIFGPSVWGEATPIPTRSCGCYHKEYTSSLFKEDLMGFQAEGCHLKVVAPAPNRGEATFWVAECQLCQSRREYSSSDLKGSANTPAQYSCGCKLPDRYTDLSGQTFGWLTAHSPHRKNGDVYWTCTCRCGAKDLSVRADHLTREQIVSCGCKPNGYDHYWTFINDPEKANEPCGFYWVEVFGHWHKFGISNDLTRRGGTDYTETFYELWGTRAEVRTLEAIILIRSKFAELGHLPPEIPSGWAGASELRQPMDAELTIAEIESVWAEIQEQGWQRTWLKHLTTN